MTAALEGACLCGDVRYRYAGPVDAVSICHCAMCRRASGSAFVPVLVASRAAVAFTGDAALTEYESSPGKRRAFCARCGAPVHSRRDDLPDTLRLRAGLIRDLPEPRAMKQQHRVAAWPWLPRLARLIASTRDAA